MTKQNSHIALSAPSCSAPCSVGLIHDPLSSESVDLAVQLSLLGIGVTMASYKLTGLDRLR